MTSWPQQSPGAFLGNKEGICYPESVGLLRGLKIEKTTESFQAIEGTLHWFKEDYLAHTSSFFSSSRRI